MKQTNKLEAVPAHRKHGTDKSRGAGARTLAQMRTACILHSQFGMTRFIGLQQPTTSLFSVLPILFLRTYRFIHSRRAVREELRVQPGSTWRRKHCTPRHCNIFFRDINKIIATIIGDELFHRVRCDSRGT